LSIAKRAKNRAIIPAFLARISKILCAETITFERSGIRVTILISLRHNKLRNGAAWKEAVFCDNCHFSNSDFSDTTEEREQFVITPLL